MCWFVTGALFLKLLIGNTSNKTPGTVIMFYRILLFLCLSVFLGCVPVSNRTENKIIEDIIQIMLTQKDNYFHIDVEHYPKKKKKTAYRYL